MEGILHLALLVFLYGCIWFVPTTINYNRRKAFLAPYWLLFITTLIIEVAIVYAVLYYLEGFNKNILFAYFPPIIASTFAGVFYFYLAKKLDEKDS